MMPPKVRKPIPPGSRVCAYPNESLKLGGGRWLEQDGEVVTDPYGYSCDLTAETLVFWEEAAVSGGHVLSELIV